MSEDLSLEELAEQFLERRRNGEMLEVETFAAAHPGYTEELRELLSLMTDMEKLGTGSTPKPDPGSDTPEKINLPDSDYRLTRKLGEGGMGVVYEAVQVSLNRRVAVKLLSASLLASPEQRTQFENEAKVIARLHHPNIVKIYSAGCSEERCYYAMELIEGQGLDRVRFDDLRELARIGLQAAGALAYAHRCGVLHRDIKPSNLLLDREGEVHLGDFGIAFILQEDGVPVIEHHDSRSGTLRYMAPERLSEGVNTYATDQYSLGVTLYELAAGRPLIEAESSRDLMKRIAEGKVPPLVCREPELAAIINKSIRFDPAERYAGMEEMESDLRHFLNREPVKAAASSQWHRFILWCRRKPAVAALVLCSCCCLAAFAVSLVAGLLRTRAALALAERNADAADSAISRVFTRISEQPASRKNTELLSDLLPYYRMIARQRNSPEVKLAEAYGVIAECALRAGNYPVAEAACRKLMQFRADAYPMNQLAAVLKKQGRRQEAAALSRQVVRRFEKSSSENDRFEVVRALLELSPRPDSPERDRAFRILEQLLKEHPDNPEYRFQYALLLGRNPRLFHSLTIPGVEPNAEILLRQLVKDHPEQPEYGLALVNLMLRKLRMVRGFQNDRKTVENAVHLSDAMLGRWPNDPQIVSAVVRLHSFYIGLLRRNGAEPRSRRENERLLSILEILFYNPEISDAVKEELFQLQLRRLKMISRNQYSAGDVELLRQKIERQLEQYRGPKREEFRKQLDEASK